MFQGQLTRHIWLLVCPLVALLPIPAGADSLEVPVQGERQLSGPVLSLPLNNAHAAMPQVLPIEPGPLTYYRDQDGDGYGDESKAIQAPAPPKGYVERALDCDDTNPQLNPETLWYMDDDGDSFGDPAFTLIQCHQPRGYVLGAGDCDDTDPAYHPGADEAGPTALDDYDCDGHVAGLGEEDISAE